MVPEQEVIPDREPASWRIRRWAAPLALAVSVAASIVAVQVLADDAPLTSGASTGEFRMPRFSLTVGRLGASSGSAEPEAWFRVERYRKGRSPLPVEAVRPPSPSVGEARAILAGPGDTFLVASTRNEPCESRLYRFQLTRDGHVRQLRRLTDAVVPGRVGGLAMSQDGDRLAYTTTPCPDGVPATETLLPARAEVTVLDVDSGDRRVWSTGGPALASEIVWARDGRTLGYVLSDVRQGAEPVIGDAVVHALDTEADGADLRAGRILFRPAPAATLTTAVMNPDGRTGYGVLRRGDPPTTVLFDFAEGEPIRVTRTFEPEPRPELTRGTGTEAMTSVGQVIVLSVSDPPRYACLGGVATPESLLGGQFLDLIQCGTAAAY
ncbi:hypothetical protein GCM10022254_17520 [Actinomadura meridiana]|uniref:Uncharacterized protein n=1 Tax=Actinomadura meridiana TaxID=559626 RepID=A0ABP8BW10_9ACTN